MLIWSGVALSGGLREGVCSVAVLVPEATAAEMPLVAEADRAQPERARCPLRTFSLGASAMLKRLLGHMRTSRFGLLAACVLPALGIGVHAPHASFVATYISSCSGGVAPSVRTKFTSAARPRSRPKSSPVDVYRRGHGPDRKYEVLGEVGVLAHSSSTGE